MAILIFFGENNMIGNITKYPANNAKANPFKLSYLSIKIPVYVFRFSFKWLTLTCIDFSI